MNIVIYFRCGFMIDPRYSLSQDACQKMIKPTTSPDYLPLIISVSKTESGENGE